MTNKHPSLTHQAILLAALCASCGGSSVESQEPFDTDTILSRLVTEVDGFYFYGPLAAAPSPAGSFRAGLSSELRLTLEATDGSGNTYTVAEFSPGSSPALREMTNFESYFVNVVAASYFTDRAAAYAFRATYRGRELGRADLSSRIFEFMDRYPNLTLGIRMRIEDQAVDRDRDGILDADDQCPDDATNPPLDPCGVCGGDGSSCGICTPSWAPNTYVAGGLEYITTLRLDPSTGDLLASQNSDLVRLSPQGEVLGRIPFGSLGLSAFAVGPDGAIYGWGSNALARIDASGTTMTPVQFDYGWVTAINVGPDGMIYAGYYAGRPSSPNVDSGGLARIDPATGAVTQLFQRDEFSVATDVAIDGNLNVYIADVNYQKLWKYEGRTGAVSLFKTNFWVLSLGVDAAGNVYGNGNVFAPDGRTLSCGFNGSWGLAVDPAGTSVYIPSGVYDNDRGWDFGVLRYAR